MSKTAVITGGSSGLGFALAKLVGKQGFQVILIARNQEKLNSSVEELKKENIEATSFACDITNENELKQTVETIKQQYTKIDFLVLNAGVVTVKLLREYTSTAEMRHDLDIDLWGTIMSAYYFESMLVEGSRALLISSALGMFGIAGYTMYSAAKAGVLNFGEAWRRELINKNINVYVACPGDIDTPQYRGEIASHPDWMKKDTPRKVATADSVAKIIYKQCKGKRKFLILPAGDVKFLNFVSKAVPRKIKDSLVDSIFPKPL
jgi:short-subunit dehydrogenase